MFFLIYNSLTKTYNVLREMEFCHIKNDLISLLEVFDNHQERLADKICYNLNAAHQNDVKVVPLVEAR